MEYGMDGEKFSNFDPNFERLVGLLISLEKPSWRTCHLKYVV